MSKKNTQLALYKPESVEKPLTHARGGKTALTNEQIVAILDAYGIETTNHELKRLEKRHRNDFREMRRILNPHTYSMSSRSSLKHIYRYSRTQKAFQPLAADRHILRLQDVTGPQDLTSERMLELARSAGLVDELQKLNRQEERRFLLIKKKILERATTEADDDFKLEAYLILSEKQRVAHWISGKEGKALAGNVIMLPARKTFTAEDEIEKLEKERKSIRKMMSLVDDDGNRGDKEQEKKKKSKHSPKTKKLKRKRDESESLSSASSQEEESEEEVKPKKKPVAKRARTTAVKKTVPAKKVKTGGELIRESAHQGEGKLVKDREKLDKEIQWFIHEIMNRMVI